jgi:hypothetical protein
VFHLFSNRELYRIVATVSNRAAPAVTGPSMLDRRMFTLELIVFNEQNITIKSLVCYYFAMDVKSNGL